MATHKKSKPAETKRRPRKRKSRLEVSSSESDSDTNVDSHKKTVIVSKDNASSAPISTSERMHREKKQSKPPNLDANQSITAENSSTISTEPISAPRLQEDFSTIYLRRVTTELADELDKVREAPDFKASSIGMLVHALKQGESMFSVDEKRRVTGAKA